jgi:hypothetical protein
VRIELARSLAACVVLLGLVLPARAHVNYIDLSDPALSPGGVNGSTFSNFGWYLGTTGTLGDSHKLAGGDFFKFSLAQPSLVSIAFSDNGMAGLLNPAFSLYRGLLPDDAHDDTLVDPQNPKAGLPPVKVASPVDNGTTADAYGRVSPFRDTAHIEFAGQFDALHSWSMGNEMGDWSVIEYLAHAGPAGGNMVSLLNYYLLPGDYTIAAAGGMRCDGQSCLDAGVVSLTGLPGTVSLTVLAVPEPRAAWLLAGGLVAMAILSRRRLRAAG